MKTSMNNVQKVMRWAFEKKDRNVGHMITELNMVDDKQISVLLNRLSRRGLIAYKRIGQTIKLHLTKEAYYGRKYLVIAR
jgi:hypothetical protein